MTFKRPFDSVSVVPAATGFPLITQYDRRSDEYGSYVLVETGKLNIDDYIQSFAREVDINYLVDRYSKGDTLALAKAQGFYADITGMPGNFADAFQLMQNGKAIFEKLPRSVAEEFSSFSDFASCFDSVAGIERVNAAFSKFYKMDGDSGVQK